jgi:hypothetical protein
VLAHRQMCNAVARARRRPPAGHHLATALPTLPLLWAHSKEMDLVFLTLRCVQSRVARGLGSHSSLFSPSTPSCASFLLFAPCFEDALSSALGAL